MTENPVHNARKLQRKLKRARKHAARAMALEQAALRGWRIVTWVLLFAGLWLFEIPAWLGHTAEIAALILFAAGTVYLVLKDVKPFKFAEQREIDRRIEIDSRLAHRPLQTLDDTLANPAKFESRNLWDANRLKALALVAKLKPVTPRAVVPLKDPYALRFAVMMFCGLGVAIAGTDTQSRLIRGLTPVDFSGGGKAREGVRLIITPPKYTGLAQTILEKSGKTALNIPAGSMLKATVHGGFGAPEMYIDSTRLHFSDAGKGNYILEFAAPKGSRLSITQMHLPRAAWNYTLIPDTPPAVALKGEPEQTEEAAIHVPLTVKDDYGVTLLTMHMELAPGVGQPPIGRPVTMTRPVLSGAGQTLNLQPTYDLSAHPWAGLPVRITFVAEDFMKQKSAPVTMDVTLPQRQFTNPLARELAGLRAQLLDAPLDHYPEIQDALEEIQTQPDAFRRDTVVLLALRAAASRLYWSGPSMKTAEGVAALLWDTALRIEDGNLSIAARNLRDAQDALGKALRDPAVKNEELARLMQNLRMAMAQYFSELKNEMQKRLAEGKQMPEISPDMLSSMIDPETLAGMLQQMESQMMAGDRNSAQKMLSQLQDMMDMTTPSAAEMPKDVQQMMESSKEMQKLIDEQQALLNDTSRQVENSRRSFGESLPNNEDLLKRWGIDSMPPAPQAQPQGQTTPPGGGSPLKRQEDLRFQLGDIMRKAGEAMNEIPPTMGQAEQDMRGSSHELGDSKPDQSIPHQQDALQHLRDGRKEIGEKLAERLKQISGLALGGGMKFDPLGRPYGDGPNSGRSFGSTVKIPDERERKQAQEILRLLQKRSGEFDRPEDELDYYRRLLRQF